MKNQLRSFHAVATAGGFTAAARQLGIGQPTISSQVKSLEDRYGIELFHRSGRTVQLTETGRGLLALTGRIASLEDEAADYLAAAGGLREGHLKVSAVGPFHVTEMLSAFRARHPAIRFSVQISNSREALSHLLDYRADVAVLAHTEADPRIHAVPYSRHPVIAFVNTEHRLARRREVSIREVAAEHVVLRERGSTTRLAFEQAIAKAGFDLQRFTEIGSREAIWMAVERGMGLGIVSEFEFIPHPRLRPLKIKDAAIYTYAHAVCLAERKQARLIRAFLSVVDELLTTRRNHTDAAVARAAKGRPGAGIGQKRDGRRVNRS